MLRILFVIPYKGVEEKVKQVFEEVLSLRGEEITYNIRLAKTGDRLEIESDVTDVVIVRGFTSVYMKTSLPKIELQVSAFDMLKAAYECLREYDCKKIAFIGTTNMIYGADSINEIIDSAEVIGRTVFDISEMDQVMDELLGRGVDAVIGGGTVVQVARKRGIPHILLKSGKESIYQAVEEAITAMKIARAEKEKREYLQAIMDYSFEGIVSTDVDGQILSANRFAAEKLISLDGTSGGRLIGRKIEEFFPNIHLDAHSQNMLAKLISSGWRRFMVNCVRLSDEETTEGWIFTFRDIENIQEDEGKIRKQLYSKGLFAKYHFDNVICRSRIMKMTIQTAMKYAMAESNVFIHGETGTGKELFAQSIHNASSRRDGPFVAVNCAALPESLLESELFGYVEGAFTGAIKGGKAGLFELAHNGTLFLDEIGDMAVNLQARLLRVIQEREIMRLGGNQVIPVNVRIIAAANKDMHTAVREGSFRQDLLYRIDVLRLELPPLRNRGEDVLELAEFYIQKERIKTGCVLKSLDERVRHWIMEQPWEGNARELRNFCERLCVLCEKGEADMEDIAAASGASVYAEVSGKMNRDMEPEEKKKIEQALRAHGFSRKETAAALNIDTSTLWRKIRKYEIDCK
ncbi:MAG: sigma 54-interacting transcriptional regulator [Clostridiales bacterium]|nr:sigma 54-interacting transcriptional regulator [Clostridiales bacterium]